MFDLDGVLVICDVARRKVVARNGGRWQLTSDAIEFVRQQRRRRSYLRYWHKADIPTRSTDVRFRG